MFKRVTAGVLIVTLLMSEHPEHTTSVSAEASIIYDVNSQETLAASVEKVLEDRHGLIDFNDPVIVIPLRQPTSDDITVLRELGREYSREIEVRPLTGLTATEALSLKRRLGALLSATAGLDDWGIGILVEETSLSVVVPEGMFGQLSVSVEREVGDFLSTYPTLRDLDLRVGDVLRISVGEHSDSDIRDTAPQGGGKWIRMSDNGAKCTLGFVVVGTNGAHYGLSAGHCAGLGDLDDNVFDLNLNGTTDSSLYGNVSHNSYANGQPDAMLWPISAWDGRARVYVSESGWKSVVGWLSDTTQIGRYVCSTGWGIKSNEGTNQKCNDVDIVNYDFTFNGITTPDTYCFERRNYGGDSGGPVYGLNTSGSALAAGITKGRRYVNYGLWETYHWCYTTISDALSIFGSYSVETT